MPKASSTAMASNSGYYRINPAKREFHRPFATHFNMTIPDMSLDLSCHLRPLTFVVGPTTTTAAAAAKTPPPPQRVRPLHQVRQHRRAQGIFVKICSRPKTSGISPRRPIYSPSTTTSTTARTSPRWFCGVARRLRHDGAESERWEAEKAQQYDLPKANPK